MKVLFVDARASFDITELKNKILSKFKKGKFGLVANIQFLPQLEEIKKILPESIVAGQVVGCNVLNTIKIKDKVDAFIYIGSAYFYPIEIAAKTKIPVYVANPLTNEISLVAKKEVEEYLKKKKGKILKFLSVKKIGILVSTKPGQENMKLALMIKEKLNKESVIGISNTLNPENLENFSDVEYWINTACSRIEHPKIINFEDIPEEYLNVKPKVESFRPNLIKAK
ncbi:diphthamide synthesis protein [Candidatus Woesearchaeota archaeon]|nr:diphthamide synthesis protein [Candidatus Woesearchaeota archaeon]